MLHRLPHHVKDIGFCAVAVVAMLLAQNVVSLRSASPIALYGDHVFLLSAARQMMEGQGFWNSNIAGFPVGQSAIYFPEFEPLIKLALFIIAQLPIGVFGIMKLFTVVGATGLVICCYYCLRRLGCSMWLAGIGAFVFAVSPYYAVRATNHDALSVYISAPFGATLALLVARLDSLSELLRLGRSAFTWIALLVIATSGLYYAFFSLMFVGTALVVMSIRIRSFWPVATLAGVSAGTLVLLMVGALGPNLGAGVSGAPTRLPVEQFYHGLSVSDAIVSFKWIPGVARISAAYKAWRPTTLVGEGLGEWPGVLITLAILASPLFVLCGPASRPPSRDRFAAAGLIALAIIVTSRGGIGFLFNELVTPAIRGQSRIMPFLMFMGLFLCLSITQELSSGARWQRVCACVIAACLLVNTVPYANQFGRRETKMENDPRVGQTIRSFHGVVEAVKSDGLHAVLELPVTSWPEVPPRDGYDYYTMILPQVFDRRGSSTRWSYGASRLQPGFGVVAATIRSEFDPEGVAFRARRLGFDGALLEKHALPAQEAERLLSALTAGQPSECLLYEDGERALIDIGQNPHCVHPDLPQPPSPIEISLQGRGSEFLDASFSAPEATGTWATSQDSTLFLPMPAGEADVTVRLVFWTFPSQKASKRITAMINGQQLGSFVVQSGARAVIDIEVPAALAPVTRIVPLHLHFDDPEEPTTIGSNDPRKLSEFIQTITISRKTNVSLQ